MLKQIIEIAIVSTVIFVGISIAIGLLITIVSSLKDFFFGTENLCWDFNEIKKKKQELNWQKNI